MGKYAILKKEFGFLAKVYGFTIDLKQKHGSYYFIIWANANKNIMVLYDEMDKVPLSIRVYDAGSFSFDAVEYKNEFVLKEGKPREQIHHAAEWLKHAIANETISV